MDTKKNETPDVEVSDTDIALVVKGKEPRNDKKVNRYAKHRGEKATICRQYGRDLATVLKLRYVDGIAYGLIGKATGLTEHMIREMCRPFAVIMDDPERVKQFKANEPQLLDGVRMLMVQGMVDQLTDEKRRKTMDLSRLTYGYGVLFDKARLERGESTANVMTLSDVIRAAHAVPTEPVTEADIVA